MFTNFVDLFKKLTLSFINFLYFFPFSILLTSVFTFIISFLLLRTAPLFEVGKKYRKTRNRVGIKVNRKSLCQFRLKILICLPHLRPFLHRPRAFEERSPTTSKGCAFTLGSLVLPAVMTSLCLLSPHSPG